MQQYKEKCLIFLDGMIILSVLGIVTAIASIVLRLTENIKEFSGILLFGDASIYIFGGISYGFTWWIYQYFRCRGNEKMAWYAIATFWTLLILGIAVIHNMQLKNLLIKS